ncbi:MAG: alpha/beta fold hydrolase [Pseudomonadota bacterium]
MTLTLSLVRNPHSRAIMLAVLLCALVVLALVQADTRRSGLTVTHVTLGNSPATIYRPSATEPLPLIVVAHGFGGSRQMMEPISTTLARAGHVVVSFDFLGHGRNTGAMSRDVTRIDGTTKGLVEQTGAVIKDALLLDGVSGDLSLVGHSMATDIVIRAAQDRSDVLSVAAISMYSDAVTQEHPARLLIVSGARETRLRTVALRAVHQIDPAGVEGQTVGAGPIKRRAIAAPGVGHVGVLYAPITQTELVAWIGGTAVTAKRGGLWTIAALAAMLVLVWLISRFLPRQTRPSPADLPVWAFALSLAGPAAIAGALAVVTTGAGLAGFAGFLVLAVFFGAYGITQIALLWRYGRRPSPIDWRASAILAVWGLAFALILDRFGAAFLPTGPRWTILAALMLGALPFILADGALLDRAGILRRLAARVVPLVALSLVMVIRPTEVGLMFTTLPVLLLFWVVYGSAGRILGQAGNGPVAPALALWLAWAIAASTPLFDAVL